MVNSDTRVCIVGRCSLKEALAARDEAPLNLTKRDPWIGKTVAGRFRIIDFIGKGGMGTVYLAEHETLPRRFAIKILKTEYLTNELFVERFRREAIASSRVVHPNVVYITDFGRLPEGNFYIVMEFLEGTGLDSLLEAQGRIPLTRALPILIQLADALDHAHKMGVVHRDLKAENVLLVEERNRVDVVKILDFGIARLLVPDCTNSRITSHGQVFGTPEYMSPEQASDKNLDGRSDIYSLGVLAFELVTGQPPFLSPNPADVLHAHLSQMPPPPSSMVPDFHVPRIFDGVVLKCLAKKPTERYTTGGEVRIDLMRVQTALLNMASQAARIPRTPENLEPVMSLPRTTDPTAEHKVRSESELREDYHSTLVELTLRLVESGLLGLEFSHAVDEIQQISNEVSSFSAVTAVKEREFEQIRMEYTIKEKNLRYAIMDLTQEIKQLSQHTATLERISQKNDLLNQVDSLKARLSVIQVEKRDKIIQLNRELEQVRKLHEEREQKSAQNYGMLIAGVEQLRTDDDRSASLLFGTLFEKLDRLRDNLDRRRQAGSRHE